MKISWTPPNNFCGFVSSVILNEDKLNGSNCSLWFFLVKQVLFAGNVWGYVVGLEG